MEFGQVPCLEMNDGTKMYQCTALYNLIAQQNGFLPEDPLDVYKGQMLFEHIINDVFYKNAPGFLFSEAGPERTEIMNKFRAEKWGPAMETLAKHLPADKKFICGDSLTLHDFTVGGLLLNTYGNPNTKDPEFWAEAKASHTPARVLKYFDDLTAEMKPYLDSRPQNCSL